MNSKSHLTATYNTRRILRLPEVMHLTGRGRVSIYNDMKTGLFPKSIKIGARAVGWDSVAIQTWMSAKAEG